MLLCLRLPLFLPLPCFYRPPGRCAGEKEGGSGSPRCRNVLSAQTWAGLQTQASTPRPHAGDRQRETEPITAHPPRRGHTDVTPCTRLFLPHSLGSSAHKKRKINKPQENLLKSLGYTAQETTVKTNFKGPVQLAPLPWAPETDQNCGARRQA